MPILLRGLREIYEEFYTGKDGSMVISFGAFEQKKIMRGDRRVRIIDDMQRLGVLFRMVFGQPGQRTSLLCGWQSEIQTYMRVLHQKEYEEKNPPQAEEQEGDGG